MHTCISLMKVLIRDGDEGTFYCGTETEVCLYFFCDAHVYKVTICFWNEIFIIQKFVFKNCLLSNTHTHDALVALLLVPIVPEGVLKKLETRVTQMLKNWKRSGRFLKKWSLLCCRIAVWIMKNTLDWLHPVFTFEGNNSVTNIRTKLQLSICCVHKCEMQVSYRGLPRIYPIWHSALDKLLTIILVKCTI